ncbi:AI-2E family transporter [Alphaproteobacteria bacterium GH1-50]|uniref:AI-2E family transporter n=1 Tax=Kangsaoukella pontilimi TaxID=2691042 RepID=A0A7C9IQT9_9RHOB|nr:AI-2E family transporter [Kangsaoukella pontilimi]MXQ08123.1 AI-2E family transporter [Kangsaoukella pontilimi]
MQKQSLNTLCLAFISLMIAAAALWAAEELLAPILAALVLGVVCAPLTDGLEKIGVPRTGAALVTMMSLLAILLAGFLAIEPTLSSAMRNAPLIWRELTEFLEEVRATLAGLEELQTTVNEAFSEDGSPSTAAEGPAGDAATVAVPGVMEALSYAPSLAAAVLVFVGTLYFFLVARLDFYKRIGQVSQRFTTDLFCRAEARVSRYFSAITAINACFGICVSLVMAGLGMSNPMLWGLAAFLLNFVLYLGPVLFAISLVVGGIVQFDGPYSFLPATIYVAMNLTEGQFVTPALVGRHMRVNPLLVFLSLVFWLWLWGPIGGVVAIPILVWALFVVGELTQPATPQHELLQANGRLAVAE